VRVGFVVYGALDRRSGGYRYDRELADRFAAAGDAVEVVSLPERSYPGAVATGVAGSRRIRRRLEALDVDVLLQDELCHPSLAVANGSLDVDYPVVALVHHLTSEESLPGWREQAVAALERRFLSTVDAYVATSETTLRAVTRLAGDAPSVVAHPAGDRFGSPVTERHVRERAREDPFRCLFVGAVTPRKRLETLVEGLARVRGDWTLTVVGDVDRDPEYVSRVRDRVAALGVADRVDFAGRLDDEALAAAYRRSHLLAVPSEYEGFGTVYVEAMGFGVPAVASTAGGASEVVRDRENGRLVDPGDASAITDVVAPLVRDRDRLVALSLGARETYREHPTWEETARRVRGFLDDVVTAK
jgi:glycosyltransferase involved in cell wall biosynthesis